MEKDKKVLLISSSVGCVVTLILGIWIGNTQLRNTNITEKTEIITIENYSGNVVFKNKEITFNFFYCEKTAPCKMERVVLNKDWRPIRQSRNFTSDFVKRMLVDDFLERNPLFDTRCDK